MGNTCSSKYRQSIYSSIQQDGTPYYRPRTTRHRQTISNLNKYQNSNSFENNYERTLNKI